MYLVFTRMPGEGITIVNLKKKSFHVSFSALFVKGVGHRLLQVLHGMVSERRGKGGSSFSTTKAF